MNNKIKYTNDDKEFLKALHEKVQSYFDSTDNDKYGGKWLYTKAFIMLLIYCFCSIYIYYAANLTQLYACYFLMGPLTVFLALNIGHEAAHYNFSRNKKLNNLLVFIFDFLGASGQIWKYKHVHSHHLDTNIYMVDKELEQPDIVRIFEESKLRYFHQFQHIYMPFLYSLYILIWFGLRDFEDYIKLKKEMRTYSPSLHYSFFIGKFIFIMRMIILPAILLLFGWIHILVAFLVCGIVASITTTFALISKHVGEHSEFPVPDSEGNLPHSWIRHQFKTTSDFATNSRLVTALYGGFNHHLAHHLFPKVAHVHYPYITPIIKEVSDEYGIPLYSMPTIYGAMSSHFRLLRKRGQEGEMPLEWMEM